MNSNLVIYVQENAIKEHTPYKDFCAFVTRHNGTFVVDYTRNPDRRIGNRADTDGVTGKLLFKHVWQVQQFILSVLGDKSTNPVSVEMHVFPGYNSFTTFHELWSGTGRGTELVAFDNVEEAQLIHYLGQLVNVRDAVLFENE